MEEFSAQVPELEQVSLGEMLGTRSIGTLCIHNSRRTVLQAQQDQSSATSVSQSDLHREMLARVREFDGDDDKLLAEYQQDIESDQPGEFRQELKGRVADSLRVHLHAERERCVIALGTS